MVPILAEDPPVLIHIILQFAVKASHEEAYRHDELNHLLILVLGVIIADLDKGGRFICAFCLYTPDIVLGEDGVVTLTVHDE